MADHLPQSVEQLLEGICREQNLTPPDLVARAKLASIGEEAALAALRQISARTVRNLSAFIIHMANQVTSSPASTQNQSPAPSRPSCSRGVAATSIAPVPVSPSGGGPSSSISERIGIAQFVALGELEFRKAFLILSYIGREELENVTTAELIRGWRHLPMQKFEEEVWKALGRKYIKKEDRRVQSDWDLGRTHTYRCHVSLDGRFIFKGPFLSKTRTHLQKVLGDDNVLMVKFAEEVPNATAGNNSSYAVYKKFAREGIPVGLRNYRFFVFKDGGKEEKKKDPTASPVRCYFVRMESQAFIDMGRPYRLYGKTVNEARSIFMHAHTVPSVARYMARLSLILSKTVTLNVDLSTVDVTRIEDICCQGSDGDLVFRDGKALVHTDGTGYISEDLALGCPKNLFKGQFTSKENAESISKNWQQNEILEMQRAEFDTKEPPLLIQSRLFYNGLAVKGTFLVNKQLPPRTIQIRESMVKVEIDSTLANVQSKNSLEIVGTSYPPKKSYLSKNLIALLSYGGVPKEYFMNVLKNALLDVHGVCSDKRAALRVATICGDRDDFILARMILSGIPLDEPHLQHRLSCLAKEEKNSLGAGKLYVPDCYYLMGTADPTGLLESNEVCIILESGQISGKVLVYRNPGLHFGDIHVLKATYLEALENFVGNAKYGIFFSCKGPRSIADEIAGGDFDGDMYWISRNRQLLEYFTPSEPWTPIPSSQQVPTERPSDLSPEVLEDKLFSLFLETRFQPRTKYTPAASVFYISYFLLLHVKREMYYWSQLKHRSELERLIVLQPFNECYTVGTAADCWLALMDRLLILDDNSEEKNSVKENTLRLINIYYDALDAPKTGGKKIEVPRELRVQRLPHFMEKGSNIYRSTSILGLIYDTVKSYQNNEVVEIEVQKLPCFDVEVSEGSSRKWKEHYERYRSDMVLALNCGAEGKTEAADAVIRKYKEILYEAPELEQSTKSMDQIFDEALAIYHTSYDYAISLGISVDSVKKCGFAWRVAGSALFKLYASKQDERSFICLQSVLKEVFG